MLPLFMANLKMLVRNREALFWALVFPILFIVVLGLFDMESMGTARVGTARVAVVDRAENTLSQQLVESLGEFDFLEIDPELTQEAPAH